MIDLIQEKLTSYQPANQLEETHAVKEILQNIALYGLWRSGFFEVAAFQGGTSLRILYGMNRFSEDLDFILKTPLPGFAWPAYLHGMTDCFKEFGLNPEILNKSRMDQRIKKVLIKDNSIINQLNLTFFRENPKQTQKIKIEIDVTPPENSDFEYSYLDFPLDFEVCHQDLSSNFSLKLHALLCRPYLKGRDWYDFSWYISRKVQPNLAHLQAALFQWGPWEHQKNNLTIDWVKHELTKKVKAINWKNAASDVQRFLKPIEQHSLSLWCDTFFIHKTKKLGLN
ncbi:MAG: nucleotidyl transferase AbiEii/AbiGii toxin family protein [Proteobacteria bacterium]|nr:nucleotidyl transferase AbiEii/AbiGii toxin family protein [Pseudomonadota bacterium]MBU1585266.1 nucleotidyl transferase AbiEii/AbiGii toxin family protein [Pseudomonadota bacterium]MBU2455518.1 nucleotidyl transferase AbiEii/AbiGii toxin family protein [Pseudomonadota bacterium]MBU2627289.1 nucleotidyl transferase AbiEii/AbiGii toxin family protein [Pseudomonadota bacterium]